MSHDMELPRTIDEPPQLMLWSADELIPLMSCVGIGIITDHFMIMLFVGIVLWRVLRRYKDSRPDGYLLHMVYWTGLPIGSSRIFVNPFRRHWHG
ncbi:type IV conjugative transfer system protein TraL [Modicisalibacter sp. MOD 31.J]|uniref:type IV conjugative transfer system protein TraL n=1 Tax=Modicisalibacter sp. MOD 31.J TaxID=2831897 RepID=UPI001CCCBDA7|nr:type IV conjugative transfer system protein TraL [Modicisalibacter sp. MOD 31.J]MBZ9574493.1 type IV conjugative transfer system protein TraL [Modicisalibacter sp. MOD 31.J]